MDDEKLCENFDFALTIQIPAFKKVEWQGQYLPYKKYDENAQKNIITYYLLDAYNKNVSLDMQHYIDLNFEKNNDERIHLHSTVRCLPAYKMRNIQNYFCKALGIRSLKQSIDMFYYEPKYSKGWEYYSVKDSLTDMENDLILKLGKKSLVVEF